MSILELEYRGDDLIISKEMAEKKLGLQPGDRLGTRPKLILESLNRPVEKIAQLEADFEALCQSFDETDLDGWEEARKGIVSYMATSHLVIDSDIVTRHYQLYLSIRYNV